MDGIQVQSVQLSRLIAALHLTLSGMAMPRQRRREATFFMHRQLVMQVQADHAQLAELGDLHQGIRLANALRPFETVVVADIRPGEGIDYLGATRCGALALEQFTLDGTGQLVPAPGPVILHPGLSGKRPESGSGGGADLPESAGHRHACRSPMSAPASPRRILFASLIGTTIEFFDFYIYATAAVLVFPHLFVPASEPTAAMLQSLATFALAFFARPLGSALFGHYGDRVGRKATLVAALLTMGISTVLIGLLPTYAQIGVAAPALLALCRFGQGLGLGGEWGGAVLLATENAPPGKRAWYGMFPQLGAPLGFLCSTAVFLLLAHFLDEAQVMAWGWRVPFLASAALVLVGLWVRLRITETPAFQQTLDRDERERLPMATVLTRHGGTLVIGTLSLMATFVLFYLMTVFALSWGTSQLGYGRQEFLLLQMVGVLCFAATIPLAAKFADRRGRRRAMILATIGIIVFGLLFQPLFAPGAEGRVLLFLCLGLGLMGLTYGPCGTILAEMFPTPVRYTGASLAFNLAGILGASPAPYIATRLAGAHGIVAVGGYLSAMATLTLLALLLVPRDAP